MAGYNYAEGMSNNALHAYQEGRKPLSKITLADLRRVGWQGTKKKALALAKAGFWKSSEYHHSGGTWYNKVDFFNPQDLIDAGEPPILKDEPAACDEKRRVKGSFPIFGGSRKRPKYLGEQTFKGTLCGNWIRLDDGRKKKADGNNIKWEFLTTVTI